MVQKAEVTELKVAPKPKKKRTSKPRVKVIDAADVIDCWKLYDKILQEKRVGYPHMDETAPEVSRFHLYNFLSAPNFYGILLKIGRHPVGMITGCVMQRPMGRPQTFFYIWNFYVLPEHRGKKYAGLMSEALISGLREKGIFNWEADANSDILKELQDSKLKSRILYHRIGEKF